MIKVSCNTETHTVKDDVAQMLYFKCIHVKPQTNVTCPPLAPPIINPPSENFLHPDYYLAQDPPSTQRIDHSVLTLLAKLVHM